MARGRMVGRLMDRKRSQRIREYRERTWCETHKRYLCHCAPLDAACLVCGCGGLCDSKLLCPMCHRPSY
jgi:hypothetical protein